MEQYNSGEQYEKLVRDKIPEILDGKGVPYEARQATPEELKTELFKKLNEEITEFNEANSPEELADVLEVVEAIKRLPGFESVDAIKEQKVAERGGFEQGIIVKGTK